jgi:N-formylglutamate deformylase
LLNCAELGAELKEFHEARPAIELGVDDSHTSTWLVAAARQAFAGFECDENQSFQGTHVPLNF